MKDIQNLTDTRQIPIKKVGVKNLQYPISVLDKNKGRQSTVGDVSLFADLPHHFKGTHMSRFIEVFNKYLNDFEMPGFRMMLEDIRDRLEAETAFADIKFPYFIEKSAPVSGQKGIMSYECRFHGERNSREDKFFVTVKVPLSTLCPCSREISDRGAHNQRGIVTVCIGMGSFVWLEDLIALIESCGSCEIFSLLKREDEKYITEKAYDNPRFVEDLVREVSLKIRELGEFPYIKVEAENFESIHNHSAYACVEQGSL